MNRNNLLYIILGLVAVVLIGVTIGLQVIIMMNRSGDTAGELDTETCAHAHGACKSSAPNVNAGAPISNGTSGSTTANYNICPINTYPATNPHTNGNTAANSGATHTYANRGCIKPDSL